MQRGVNNAITRATIFTIGVLLLYAAVNHAQATIISVTNTNDSGPGSLRQALADANDGDTINFDPALNGRNISLTSAELVVDKDVIINGPGPNLLGVFRSSNAYFRIFHVMANSTVTIAGLTMSGGAGAQQGGG